MMKSDLPESRAGGRPVRDLRSQQQQATLAATTVSTTRTELPVLTTGEWQVVYICNKRYVGLEISYILIVL
jgi:hypothetical protein